MYTTSIHTDCLDHPQRLVLYNPLPNHDRILCNGKITIKANSVLHVGQINKNMDNNAILSCLFDNDDGYSPPPITNNNIIRSKLFNAIPDITGQHLPPTILQFGDHHYKKGHRPFKDCDVPCQRIGQAGRVFAAVRRGARSQLGIRPFHGRARILQRPQNRPVRLEE